jgi:hypothetical protein
MSQMSRVIGLSLGSSASGRASCFGCANSNRLGLRSGWWQDDIQVETLAALAALVNGYDSGAWNDPAAKLQVLYDLDRIRGLLRAGDEVFDPERDRDPFVKYLVTIGCDGEPGGAFPDHG